jgi:hypothetical protein
MLLYSVFAECLSEHENINYPRKPTMQAVAEIPILPSVSGYLFKLMM